MKLNQENVLRLLQSVSDRGATVKEILSALGQKQKRKAQLRKILKRLASEKICYKQNNRYYLNQEAEISTPARRSSKRRTAPPTGRSHRKQDHLGQVLHQGRAKTVYSFFHKKRFSMTKGDAETCFHGDLVDFSLQKAGKQNEPLASVNELLERRITRLKGELIPEKKGRYLFQTRGKHVPRQFPITQSLSLKKNEQATAWLDLATTAFHHHKAAGSVQLIHDNNPYNSPVLEQILVENKIPSRFPEAVLKACQSLPKSVRLSANSRRIDLRSLPFVTIDGEDAKDFDDAIYARSEGEHYRIWVSIADVADYVPEGSPVDREAFARGTSTYLPGAVYPMLPEALSNGLCSLKEGVNRKTLTCESVIDKNGKTLSWRIYASIHKIACRLTYTAVQRFFETRELTPRKSFPELGAFLECARMIAQILRKRRVRAGFIDFHLPETAFKYDKKGQISDVGKTYQSEAMQVIEQFMLLANENVATYCDQHKLPIIWRNHPEPDPEKLKKLKQLLWNANIRVPTLSTGKDYNKVMRQIQDSPEKDFLEYSMLRSMSLATYETRRYGHFGIASNHYCHFTSPIRRYPDLMVHRALRNHLHGKNPVKIPEYVAAVASERERLATSAERAATKFHKTWFMADFIGEIFQATISGMIHSGLFVEIEHPYVDGFVSFATIHDDHYEFDEPFQCIRGIQRKTRFTIGSPLQVLLTRLDWNNLSPEFDWICWKEDV